MAIRRIRTALTLLTGAAVGFLAAVLLQEAPPPGPAVSAPREPADTRQQTETAPAPVRRPDPRGSSEAASLAEILRLDGEFEQTAALYALIRQTDQDELERLILEAELLPASSDRQAALSILYGRFADFDAEAALAFLLGRGGGASGRELRGLFHAWSRRDLTAAVEAAAGLSPQMRATAGMTILASRDDLSTQAQRDIARRLEIEGLLPQIAMQQVLHQVDRDPLTAWQAALATGDGPLRQQRLAGIAQAWAREDPLAAMEAVASLSSDAMRHQLQTQILYQWTRWNAQEAVDWALAQPPSPERRQLTTIALSGMAESEPRLAFDIAQSLGGQEGTEAVGQILARWAQDDPMAAARSAELLPSGNARRSAIFSIASHYARQDPQGALQWVSAMDPEETSPAVHIIFTVLTQQDPNQAGNLLSVLPDGNRAEAAAAVASAWVRQDAENAARWVDSLVDEELRQPATASLLNNWANADREGALRYAERIPDTGERDAAFVSIMQTQVNDLAFSERLFGRLNDPAQRALAARLLYFNLREADPQRAEHYREIAGIGDHPGISR